MGQPDRKRSTVPILRPLLFSSNPPHTTTTKTPPPAPPPTTTHARRRFSTPNRHSGLSTRSLTEEELLLAGQLEEVWRFRRAAEFVAEHGFDVIAQLVQVVSAEIELGRVDNPPAFLRWLARQEPG